MNIFFEEIFLKIKIKPNRICSKIFFPSNDDPNDEDEILGEEIKKKRFIFIEKMPILLIKFHIFSDEILKNHIQLIVKEKPILKREGILKSKKLFLFDINKKNILENLNKKTTIKEISISSNLNYNLTKRFIRKIQLTNKHIKEKENKNKLREIYTKLVTEFIEKDNNRFFSLKDIKTKFEQTHEFIKNLGGNYLSNSQFYKLVTSKKYLNYSYKCASKYFVPELNEEISIINRYNYSKILMNHKVYRHEVIYIDETGIKLSDFSKKGWTRRGNKCKYNKRIYISKNISIIVAISNRRIISFMFYRGGLSGNTFVEWLLKTYKILNLDLSKTLFVLDNLKSHKPKKFINKLNLHFQFLYLPPYMPMMNPTEYLFCYIKQKLKKIRFTSEKSLFEYLKQEIWKISNNKLQNFEMKANTYVLKSINQEKIT